MMIKGSCSCGRIQYQTQAQPSSPTACHCKTCQQISGGSFLAFIHFPTAELEWTKEQPDLWSRSDIADRGFCSTCGSSLSMVYHFEKEKTGVCLGSVNEAEPALPKLEAHIFLAEKASWFVVPEDGARRQDGFSAEHEALIAKWKAANGLK